MWAITFSKKFCFQNNDAIINMRRLHYGLILLRSVNVLLSLKGHVHVWLPIYYNKIRTNILRLDRTFSTCCMKTSWTFLKAILKWPIVFLFLYILNKTEYWARFNAEPASKTVDQYYPYIGLTSHLFLIIKVQHNDPLTLSLRGPSLYVRIWRL